MGGMRRGVATILGVLIAICIVFTCVIPLWFTKIQVDTIFEKSVTEVRQSDLERASEDLSLTTIGYTLFLSNDGPIPILVKRVWFNDFYEEVNLQLPIFRFVRLSFPDLLEGTYDVMVVTERGRTFVIKMNVVYVFEDFTTYTEHDIDANRIQDVTDFSYQAVKINREEIGIRLIKDYGANYFTDFIVKFDAQAQATDSTGRGYCWGLSNEDEDLYQNVNPAVGLRIKIATAGAGEDRIRWELWDLDNPAVAIFNIVMIEEPVHYDNRYFTITKQGAEVRLDVYSDAARTTLIGSDSGTLQGDHSFRYTYALSAEDRGQVGGVALTYLTQNHIYEHHWDEPK